MIVDKDSATPNSLAVPSTASFVVKMETKRDIPEACAFAREMGLPLIVVGEGTNIVPTSRLEAVVAIPEFGGIKMNRGRLIVMAGEKWDSAVGASVNNNLSGIETLSGIPGKAGAAPVQNIGAYGSEISDCLESVEVYDRAKKEFAILSKKECLFGYRNSLFKEHPGKFVVTSITLKLSGNKPKIPKYKGVEEYFKQKNNDSPNLKEIREAIIEIRSNKLPDPRIIPNAGSYFINPVIKNKKIYAGELIEKAGLKGTKIGQVEIFSKNALILTNPKRVGFEEILKAENFIVKKVFQEFGIVLEREPQIVSC